MAASAIGDSRQADNVRRPCSVGARGITVPPFTRRSARGKRQFSDWTERHDIQTPRCRHTPSRK
jgi:hypothetical protein